MPVASRGDRARRVLRVRRRPATGKLEAVNPLRLELRRLVELPTRHIRARNGSTSPVRLPPLGPGALRPVSPALMPADLTSGSHLSISARSHCAAVSGVVSERASIAMSPKRCRVRSSRITALALSLSLRTIAAGVPAGAKSMCQCRPRSRAAPPRRRSAPPAAAACGGRELTANARVAPRRTLSTPSDATLRNIVGAAGEQVGHGRRRAAVGHVVDLEIPGLPQEQLRRQMHRAARPGTAVVVPAGRGAEHRYEVLQAPGRDVLVHHQQHRDDGRPARRAGSPGRGRSSGAGNSGRSAEWATVL